jgi:hypothetical protein
VARWQKLQLEALFNSRYGTIKTPPYIRCGTIKTPPYRRYGTIKTPPHIVTMSAEHYKA